ncbi:unnamed protein product [Urochloa humidicola]
MHQVRNSRLRFICIEYIIGGRLADNTTSTSSSEGATTMSSGAAASPLKRLLLAAAATPTDDKRLLAAVATPMDRRLLAAATTGDTISMQHLASQDPAVLLGTTPQGNTCLHIASIHGHEEFCKDVQTFNQSLSVVTATNDNGETPLLAAVARVRATVSSVLLGFCRDQQLRETILKQDKHGFNALHHAICSGHRKLALKLIEAESALSKAVNKRNESPMFVAVIRDYGDVLEKLLEIPDAAHGGGHGYNSLHEAVTTGNAVMAKRIVEALPGLIRQENEGKRTPVHLAAQDNKIDVLTVLLEHDPSLAYFISAEGAPLLSIAASQGNVGVARELLRHCPDPPYYDATGSTCLHIAVLFGREDFVRFVLNSPQLRHLVNLPDDRGKKCSTTRSQNCASR